MDLCNNSHSIEITLRSQKNPHPVLPILNDHLFPLQKPGSSNGVTEDKNAEAALVNDFHAIKRMRLDSSEKNIQHEIERQAADAEMMMDEADKEGATSGGSAGGGTVVHDDDAEVDDETETVQEECAAISSSSDKLKEAVEADRCWDKYLALNDTVVARTFQVCTNYQQPL